MPPTLPIPTTATTRLTLRRCLFPALLLVLSGCSAGPRNFENENDRLRAQVMELTEKNQALQREAEDLKKALEVSQKHANAAGKPLPEGVTPPVLSRVSLANFSGGIDTDNDGNDDALRLYILTEDQRSRFIQVIGTLTVTASATQADKDPVTVARLELAPRQLSDQYRSTTFGGTHYSVVVPITAPVPADQKQLLVNLLLRDAATGEAYEHKELVRWTTR